MNAVLKPITARAIEKPRYDNRHLSDPLLWLIDNATALDNFWCSLSDTYGRPDLDYFRWLACQHDIEVIRSQS